MSSPAPPKKPPSQDPLALELRETQERLRDTLEAAEVGTWEWNIADDQVTWSPNIERIFAIPPGSFAGTYEAWLALVHPEDREIASRKVAEAIEGRAPYAAELRVIRPDGSIGWQHTRGHVVSDEAGRPKLLRGVVYDVTARRSIEETLKTEIRRTEELAVALRASEARYRSFVEQSTEGIWRCELRVPVAVTLPADEQIDAFYRDGFMDECNDAMARMYGYDAAEALQGMPLSQLLVREDPHNTEYLRAFIESGYRLENAESHELDREGKPRVFSNSLVGVIEDGRIVRAWGTQRDITAQVEARDQLESASRAKDEFLAMLGHELRNPLSPILTALDLMKLRGADTFAKEREIIERQLRHVVRLVDDLLDVSRMTRGKVTLSRARVDLADSVETAIELARPLLDQRAHRLTVDVPRGLTVHGDGTRLSQIFANLVTNAAKYTPDGGAITITGTARGDTAVVSIRDTGIGIRKEILPKVFDLFVQERQSLDRSEGGLGLGLAIVRTLVALHGGKVEAHSEGPGRGSQFIVELPLADGASAPRTQPREPVAAAATRRRSVLIVDDNEDAAVLLADALGDLGHETHVEHDGPAALAWLEDHIPDVALLDIGLPVMDGYEIARRVRAQDRLGQVRLVAVTGYGQAKDRAAAKDAGFDDHLVKPVELAKVEAVIGPSAKS